MTRRETVDVGGVPISYLTAGEGGPLVLLLHGTYWSRVWQPVLDGIAAAGLRPVAVDFPGFGRSGGELTLSEASVPRLSAWLVRFLEALGHRGPVMVAGHDIGGGVAQHLMLANKVEVPRVAVVNGIMYDSWPVPGVARFRDPAVAAATTRDDVLAARRVSVVKALGRPASEAEITEYLEPWTDPRVARSLAVARGRGRPPLHHGDAAGSSAVKDAQASGVGRRGRFPDGGLCRTLCAGDPGNAARSDQVGRPHPDGERPKGSDWSADRFLCCRAKVTEDVHEGGNPRRR
jgi:pimeloyl-ACP methyl ester carboxylesterase